MRLSIKNYRHFLKLNFSPVIKILTISDILILSGFGLVAPIFAIYITNSVKGGSVEVAGLATMIYLLARSLGQLPAAFIIDKIKGENDDYTALVIGSVITSFVPLFYIFATNIPLLYLVQFIYGLSQAFTYPSWSAIFTRHIDRNREGMEWGIYTTFVDLGGATVAGLGGYVAYIFGFKPLFIVVSIMSFLGCYFLTFLKPYLKQKIRG